MEGISELSSEGWMEIKQGKGGRERAQHTAGTAGAKVLGQGSMAGTENRGSKSHLGRPGKLENDRSSC